MNALRINQELNRILRFVITKVHIARQKKFYSDRLTQFNKKLSINPHDIQYKIHTRNFPPLSPDYGVLDGNWDMKKVNLYDDPVRSGLKQRFGEGNAWEDTSYYKYMSDFIENNPNQKIKGFDTLEGRMIYLDDLYSDIKNNGWEKSSIIIVCLGRHGEWMLKHGNHRLVIAQVLGLESVPVKIKYRHANWQRIRQKVNSNAVDELSEEVLQYINHPDISTLVDDGDRNH